MIPGTHALSRKPSEVSATSNSGAPPTFPVATPRPVALALNNSGNTRKGSPSLDRSARCRGPCLAAALGRSPTGIRDRSRVAHLARRRDRGGRVLQRSAPAGSVSRARGRHHFGRSRLAPPHGAPPVPVGLFRRSSTVAVLRARESDVTLFCPSRGTWRLLAARESHGQSASPVPRRSCRGRRSPSGTEPRARADPLPPVASRSLPRL